MSIYALLTECFIGNDSPFAPASHFHLNNPLCYFFSCCVRLYTKVFASEYHCRQFSAIINKRAILQNKHLCPQNNRLKLTQKILVGWPVQKMAKLYIVN